MNTHFRNITLGLACASILCASCDDVFDTTSTSVTFAEDNRMDSPNDSMYTVVGLLSQLQQVGERYVLMGELRGDLMQATDLASVDLQEVSDFNVSAGNIYNAKADYYNIINNCNYALSRMDTTVTIYQSKVLLPEYAQIKALRAWTYWQVALLYGKATWIEQPILDLESSLADYPQVSIDDLAGRLVNDLQPFYDIHDLDYGTIDGYSSSKMFIPIPMLLGDLYLYLGQYHEAAAMYYDLIVKRHLTITNDYASQWTSITRDQVNMRNSDSYTGELLSGFVYSSDPRSYHPMLIRLAYNDHPSIVPASSFVDHLNRTTHFYAEGNSTQILGFYEGDLRGEAVSKVGTVTPGALGNIRLGETTSTYITKYISAAGTSVAGYDPDNTALTALTFTRLLPIYRTPHLFLRFAEALNRGGRPTLAFAILKYGLNATTLGDSTLIHSAELEGTPFSEFAESWCQRNVGTALRGCGRGVPYDKTFFVIEGETLQDSILSVEDHIVDELAAETSFEGNRFFDLLRVARHRNAFPAYMAAKVATRFGNADAMEQTLSDPDKWFLK